MSGRAKERRQFRRLTEFPESAPEIAVAKIAAHAIVTGASLQAAAARSTARWAAGTALLVATLGLGGVALSQGGTKGSPPPIPSSAPAPIPNPPSDYLLREAEQAKALADVELFIAATYAMDCTSGGPQVRANCQNVKAARFAQAHADRERILATGKK
jgi:hypothetical protein